jgi:hypothetical protein
MKTLLKVYSKAEHQDHITNMTDYDVRSSAVLVGPSLIMNDIKALSQVGYDGIDRVIREILKVYPHLRKQVEQVRQQETSTDA